MTVAVAGIDSSTQSCKVVVRDAESGDLLRSGRASHPDGTAVDPEVWWRALMQAVDQAGGLDDVVAVSVAAQQHGMIALDAHGIPTYPALMWNDTRSAPQATALTEARGPRWWAEHTGSVPLASYTVTKLAWLAEHESAAAGRTDAVALPHDWLTWRLAGGGPGVPPHALVTDRSDVSGTGYWDPAGEEYEHQLVREVLGHDVRLPRVLGPHEVAGTATGWEGAALLGPGAGDNAAAALALGARAGEVVLSVGTSGVVAVVSERPVQDATGLVSGFADARGGFLPLACTLNAARVLDAAARLVGAPIDELDALAEGAPAGCDGLVLVPYLEGERTPNLPDATGSLHGLTLRSSTPAHVARAAVESVACSLADALAALAAQGVPARSATLVGGGARSRLLRQTLADLMQLPVTVPHPSEYVADGAALQAAWALSGRPEPPRWAPSVAPDVVEPQRDLDAVRHRYAEARGHVLERLG